jgi:hypothetical protein
VLDVGRDAVYIDQSGLDDVVIDVERSLGCELHSVHIAVVLLVGGNDGYKYQMVVENLWLDNTKKVPSIVVATTIL